MPALLDDFRVRLGLVVVGGLAVRVAWVLAWARDQELAGDQVFYHFQGRALADGAGFVNPYAWNDTARQLEIPTAVHPPLYSLYLGAVSLFGGRSELTHRMASVALGAACVVLVGLVARRLAGDRAGLLAAVAAALYPNLWINDGLLAAESLYAPAIAVVLLTAYRLWDDVTAVNAAWLGAAIAVAALTRAEAALLFVLLAVPLVVVLRRADLRRKVVVLGWVALAGLVTMSPWLIRNLTTFDDPVFLSSGAGYVIEIANCDETYSGPMLGYWSTACDRAESWVYQPEFSDDMSADEREAAIRAAAVRNATHEAANERSKRAEGLSYMGDNLDRLPVVVAARVGRMWDVWRPAQGIDLNVFFERRSRLASEMALAAYYVLLPLALVGGAVLWRRRVTVVPFVALALMATITAAVSFGITRYRVGLDVGLTVLAGVGVDALWCWFRERRGPRASASEAERVEADR